MKHIYALLLAFSIMFGARAAAPSYANFYTNDFSTNGLLVKIKWLNVPAVSNFYVTNILVVETGYFGNLYISNNLFVSNIYATNIYASNIFTTNLFVTNVYVTNFNTTNITVNNLYATNIFTTNLFSSNIFTTNIFANTTYTTNLFVTNLFSSNIFTTNILVNNAYTTNLFSSNHFTTNLFVNNAYTTNLFSSNHFTTNLIANTIITSNIFTTNLFATNIYTSNFYATNIFVNNTLLEGGHFWTNRDTYYVAATSTSNGVKGLIEFPYAISNAWAAAAVGDTIVILPGTYSVTNTLTNKVWMRVVGVGNPLLRWFNGGVTNGQTYPCILPADNNYIGFLSITNAAVSHGVTIGLSSAYTHNAATNVLVESVSHSGGSDGTFFAHTNKCQVRFLNNNFSCPWDNHVQGLSSEHEFTFDDCDFNILGPYFVFSGSFFMQRTAGLVMRSGTAYVNNCTFKIRGSTNGNYAIYFIDDAGTVDGAVVIAKDSSFITTNAVVTSDEPTAMATLINCVTNGLLITTTNHFFENNLTVALGLTNNSLSANMPVWTDANKKLVSVSPSWLPVPNYELWYEPFSGGDATTGLIGLMNWSIGSAGVGGGSVNFSNAPNHFGTMNLGSSSSANSIAFLFNSDSANGKPTIAPLNATIGWTNRFIWRMNNTNTARVYFGFIGNANYTVNAALENSICFFINTTNSNFIMGHTSVGSAVSTTNIVGIVNNQWYTNEMWSDTSGVISFNVNGGAPAMLAANLPTSSLTPSFGVIKQATDVAVNFEVDEWVFFWKRQ